MSEVIVGYGWGKETRKCVSKHAVGGRITWEN
jgi:hypothetical protein